MTPTKVIALCTIVTGPALREVVGFDAAGEPIVRRTAQTVGAGDCFTVSDSKQLQQLLADRAVVIASDAETEL